MELNGYRLLLPEGTLDYFDLVDVKESVNEVVFYLEEKNIVPEKYTDQDTESKGFYDPVIVQDFPLRGKKVFLNIRRRRWLLNKQSEWTLHPKPPSELLPASPAQLHKLTSVRESDR